MPGLGPITPTNEGPPSKRPSHFNFITAPRSFASAVLVVCSSVTRVLCDEYSMPMRRSHSYFPLYRERTLITHVRFCYGSTSLSTDARLRATVHGPQRHAPSRPWTSNILSLASEVDRLKKSSTHKYALLVSKKSMLRMGPLGSDRGPSYFNSL